MYYILFTSSQSCQRPYRQYSTSTQYCLDNIGLKPYIVSHEKEIIRKHLEKTFLV